MGAVLHLDRTPASATPARLGRIAAAVASCATLALAACGNQYRPVVSAINPVGPAGQPTKYAAVISSPSSTSQGIFTLIDFSGDTILNTTLIGINPQYFILAPTGYEGYTLNGDGTLNSFSIASSLLASQVLTSTVITGSTPVSLYPQGTYLYIAEGNNVAELNGLPPAVQSLLPTGANTIYTVGVSGSPRAYALSQGTGGSNGTAVPIETSGNTTDAAIPVGVAPTYGVMSSDSRRAFILNKGSNSVTVINAQSNALDNFGTAAAPQSTVPVGIAPIWADFAPTLNELLVLNQGNGTGPGSVSVINIPLCSTLAVLPNQNCDTSNPIDAVGFGQILATIPVGVNPVMISCLQDGTQCYVANSGNSTTAGSISVINLSTYTVDATIPAISSGTLETDSYVHGHPNYIAATTGTPTGKVYITAPDSTDITILRTDLDAVTAHLTLQGYGVSVRVTAP